MNEPRVDIADEILVEACDRMPAEFSVLDLAAYIQEYYPSLWRRLTDAYTHPSYSAYSRLAQVLMAYSHKPRSLLRTYSVEHDLRVTTADEASAGFGAKRIAVFRKAVAR